MTVLVGQDDEAWNFALTVPMAILDELVAATASLTDSSRRVEPPTVCA